MITSVRTRLTLVIALVFLGVFILLFIVGALTLYLGLNEEIDGELAIENKRLNELFETEYSKLVDARDDDRKMLRDELLEDIDEMYKYKNQFAILSLETATVKRIYAGGLKNAQLLLPKG